MTSLIDVAKAMELEKNKGSTRQQSISSHHENTVEPKRTLLEVAQEQESAGNSANGRAVSTNKLTLLDVAKQSSPSERVATQPKASTEQVLSIIAHDIDREEAVQVDTAITAIAQTVKQEESHRHANALKEAVTEVKREEARAAQLLRECAEPVSTEPVNRTRESEEADGYSSFEDDDDTDPIEPKLVVDVPKQKKANKAASRSPIDCDPASDTGETQDVDDGNQSEASSAAGDAPEQTIASDSQVSKQFMQAVFRGDIRRVRDLLDSEQVEVNTADQHGWSALHWAASQGHSDLLKLLLARDTVGVNAVEQLNGWTPLHVAVIREAVDCARELFSAGADMKLRDKYGDSARASIRRACQGRRASKARKLLLLLFEEQRHHYQC